MFSISFKLTPIYLKSRLVWGTLCMAVISVCGTTGSLVSPTAHNQPHMFRTKTATNRTEPTTLRAQPTTSTLSVADEGSIQWGTLIYFATHCHYPHRSPRPQLESRQTLYCTRLRCIGRRACSDASCSLLGHPAAARTLIMDTQPCSPVRIYIYYESIEAPRQGWRTHLMLEKG